MFSAHFNLHKHYITFLCLPFFHFADNACNTPGKNVFNLVLFSSLKEFISSIRYFLKFLKLTVFQYVTYHANKIRWINIHHITLQTLLKIKLSVNPITFSLKIKTFFLRTSVWSFIYKRISCSIYHTCMWLLQLSVNVIVDHNEPNKRQFSFQLFKHDKL